ncbi:Os01g0729050 [Oryza sativa Japonica Group]|uniref:Os01g0729050 protein n=1 Tax=Oryza sativa subsp. japonica TaxID=39947 RepID=C7IXU4_ORYSJ|nr:Os01g0729050 [Oryza sativa Japonica Group]|eukprot:NP_001172552.1 Os01g0729050 [Oryza sativa Japonica Group]
MLCAVLPTVSKTEAPLAEQVQ